jgi:hypothetical protein
VVTVADEDGNGFCNALRVEGRDNAVLIWPTAVASESPRAAVVAALGGYAKDWKRQAYEIPRWDLPLGQCVRDPTGGDSEATCRGVTTCR